METYWACRETLEGTERDPIGKGGKSAMSDHYVLECPCDGPAEVFRVWDIGFKYSVGLLRDMTPEQCEFLGFTVTDRSKSQHIFSTSTTENEIQLQNDESESD